MHLSVKPATPTVTGTEEVSDGTTTTLTCESSDELPSTGVSYVWKRNGDPVDGAVTSTYTTPNVALSNLGDKYTCAVTVNNVASDDSTTPLTLTGGFISSIFLLSVVSISWCLWETKSIGTTGDFCQNRLGWVFANHSSCEILLMFCCCCFLQSLLKCQLSAVSCLEQTTMVVLTPWPVGLLLPVCLLRPMFGTLTMLTRKLAVPTLW